MNNTALAGIIVGAVALAAAGSIVANSGYNPFKQYATVVSVEPAFDVTRTPRELCGEEAALARTRMPPGGDVAETAAATPAPAQTEPAKPEAGAKAEAEAGAVTEAATDCVVVYDTSSVQAGYDVTYELDGVQKVVRMDHDPGRRIPVEDGELVLTLR
jgi:uncharacterized protein YcfJ